LSVQGVRSPTKRGQCILQIEVSCFFLPTQTLWQIALRAHIPPCIIMLSLLPKAGSAAIRWPLWICRWSHLRNGKVPNKQSLNIDPWVLGWRRCACRIVVVVGLLTTIFGFQFMWSIRRTSTHGRAAIHFPVNIQG
jgi:hypothetical protein